MAQKKSAWLKLILIALAIPVSMLAIQGCGSNPGSGSSQKITLQTEYQAVFLVNGQVYFGKAEIGNDFITLRDVFYIQSQVNQETKEVRNTLIKRGKEWHGPDLMYINRTQVALIEPISPNSQVATLIKEAATQKPAEKK